MSLFCLLSDKISSIIYHWWPYRRSTEDCLLFKKLTKNSIYQSPSLRFVERTIDIWNSLCLNTTRRWRSCWCCCSTVQQHQHDGDKKYFFLSFPLHDRTHRYHLLDDSISYWYVFFRSLYDKTPLNDGLIKAVRSSSLSIVRWLVFFLRLVSLLRVRS